MMMNKGKKCCEEYEENDTYAVVHTSQLYRRAPAPKLPIAH